MKNFITNLLILTVTFAICLVVGEFAIRHFLPQFNPAKELSLLPDTDNLPRRGAPNSTQHQYRNTGEFHVQVSFNEQGLRESKDLTTAQPEDWFVVGDSYSFGWGVEADERYGKVLQDITGEKVYNLAMPGYDLTGYEKMISYAQEQGVEVKNVIFGICMENDILPYGDPEALKKRQSMYESNPVTSSLLGQVKSFLMNHTATYLVITTMVHQNPVLKDMFQKAGLIGADIAYMYQNTYDAEVIDSTVNYLKRLSKGRNVVVMTIPVRGLWTGQNAKQEAKVHAAFVQRLKQEGFTVADMRPVWEATGNPLALHFKRDGHWTKQGHKLAAEHLAKYID